MVQRRASESRLDLANIRGKKKVGKRYTDKRRRGRGRGRGRGK